MALPGGAGRRRTSPAAKGAEGSVTLPPPDLRLELLALETRFGRAALKSELARLTKRKVGRPPLKDLSRLAPQFEKDARDLMAGKDPYELSPGEIAKELADADPGHRHSATRQRLRGFIWANRAEQVLLRVFRAGPDNHPARAYVSALQWPIPPRYSVSKGVRMLAAKCSGDAEAAIALYRERLGEPPVAMTLSELEAELRAWTPPGSRPDLTGPLSVLWDLDGSAGGTKRKRPI
jgi:hypothetical protein